jgi:hydrogenase nickel incorporation protein HypA/HybF
MHELSIVEGLLEIVERERRKHHFTRVKSIEITCGRYNCVSQEALNFCLQALGTAAHLAGACCTINRLAENFCCADCGRLFEAQGSGRSCPACNSDHTIIELRNELYVSALEVE